jgi:hypothetical protein
VRPHLVPMSGLRGRWRAGAVTRTVAAVAGLAALPALGGAVPATPARAAATGRPEVAGAWTPPFEEGGRGTPRCQPDAGCKPPAVEMAVLPDGRVLYFVGAEGGESTGGPTAAWPPPAAVGSGGPARILDLRSGPPERSTPTPPAGGLFCADLTELPDGRVLIVGGPDGNNAALFDPATDSFQPAAPMKHGRWYPQVAIGPDGDATVFGGATRIGVDTPLGQVRRTETYHAATNTWADNDAGHASENGLPPEPRVVLAPDGRFLYTAAGQMWGPGGQSPDEATTALYQFYDPKKKTWSVSGPAPVGARSGAFVVPLTLEPPYDRMTVLTFGGVLGPTPGTWLPANPLATLTTVDANGTVSSAATGRLNHARWFGSGVLLPDGQVLAVGGDDKDDALAPGFGVAVKIPELYDPATGTWTDVAPQARDRGYHNSALLLPDMRVLLGGNAPIPAGYGDAHHDVGRPFANNDDDPSFEIWSPPYLFRGPRPVITAVQRGLGYGESFDITTPDAGLIDSVVLLRTPSPEHANDSDQRALELEFTRSGEGRLTATAPPSGTVAPPGSYYLVVNRRSLQGPIPSVARMVDVGRRDRADARQPFADEAPVPVNGSATPDDDTSRLPAVIPNRRRPSPLR